MVTQSHRAAWPAAVLWDMDGTLVDTEPYWITAETELAHAHGRSWTVEQGLQLVGNALPTTGRMIQQQLGLDLSPDTIVERLLARVTALVQEAVPWRPGALELLTDLATTGIPTALVTMSYAGLAGVVVAALPEGSFRAVVTGDQVTRGKPHPEPYLTAAERLGVPPADCLVIEDSDTGARSAETAGCRVLVVPHHVPVPATGERVFRDSLTGLRAGQLSALQS